MAQAGLVRSGPEPTAVSLGGSAFFASILSIPIALRRQPYLAQHARGCAECHYQASLRNDSLAERGEFELPVPICEQSDDSIRLALHIETNCKSAIAQQRISSAL